jgi:predicted small secreted protein
MMKKYSVLLAIIVLVLASLACQTVMGGGKNIQVPGLPSSTEVPPIDGAPTASPSTTDGGVTVGGNSEFPATSDAFNVVTAAGTLTFQTKMSSDDVIKFYRDEFAKQGYKEDASKAITFGKTFTLAFDGHSSGKVIYVVGADAGDGSIYVTITLG